VSEAIDMRPPYLIRWPTPNATRGPAAPVTLKTAPSPAGRAAPVDPNAGLTPRRPVPSIRG